MRSRRHLDDFLSTHHGVVSTPILHRLGINPTTVRSAARRGDFVPVLPGVWRSAAHAPTAESAMSAACLAHPSVLVAFTSAGRLWGLRKMADNDIHVLVPHCHKLALPGYVVHRSRRIDDVDVAARRPDGIVLTSPPRTVFDCGALIGVDSTASVVEQVLAEHRCTLATLLDTLARLRHAHRPGSAVLERVLTSRPAWRRAARSDLEVRLLRAVERAELPAPEVNLRVRVGDRIHVFDLAWPDHRVCVEVDHPFWHDSWEQNRQDKRRDRKSGAAGWYTARLEEADIDQDLDDAVADLRAIIQRFGWPPDAA
jgi:very-short-patch-repair endonuclease